MSYTFEEAAEIAMKGMRNLGEWQRQALADALYCRKCNSKNLITEGVKRWRCDCCGEVLYWSEEIKLQYEKETEFVESPIRDDRQIKVLSAKPEPTGEIEVGSYRITINCPEGTPEEEREAVVKEAMCNAAIVIQFGKEAIDLIRDRVAMSGLLRVCRFCNYVCNDTDPVGRFVYKCADDCKAKLLLEKVDAVWPNTDSQQGTT